MDKSLPEIVELPSAWGFTECILSGTRQTSSLPSAAKNTLGKIMSLGKQTLCRVLKNIRQTMKKHSAKHRHSTTNCHVDIRQLVCRPLEVYWVSVSGTRQRNKFAECFFCTRQRNKFAECFFCPPQINKFFSLLTLKLFLLSTYNMWYSMLRFGIFLDLFAIFN